MNQEHHFAYESTFPSFWTSMCVELLVEFMLKGNEIRPTNLLFQFETLHNTAAHIRPSTSEQVNCCMGWEEQVRHMSHERPRWQHATVEAWLVLWNTASELVPMAICFHNLSLFHVVEIIVFRAGKQLSRQTYFGEVVLYASQISYDYNWKFMCMWRVRCVFLVSWVCSKIG